jgi:hypothetical protein
MADVDVSELLCDPDFVDPIQVITRVTRVDLQGKNRLQEQVQNTFGSVQPAKYAAVMKAPEAMRVENLMSFWFKGAIIASAPGDYSSILVFKGKRYQVKTVSDWSSFGDGFTEGLCVAQVPT